MRHIKLLFICIYSLILFTGCNEDKREASELDDEVSKDQNIAYATYGKEIIDDDALSLKSATTHYRNLKMGDSINVKFRTNVNEVCQAKGCWMKAELSDGGEVMVKFKDYGFFVPKDISGKEIVLNGLAFVDEMSVEDQRHYAEDEGLSKDEIDAITAPKTTYSFLADGVLVRED